MHPLMMQRAINTAQQGLYTTGENPRVGAVLARGDQLLATGYHATDGGDHAEVALLKNFTTVPDESTMYVTLEPCCYRGKTPACTEALIQAGVTNIYVAMLDPNPRVAGKGVALLRQAGCKVTVTNTQQAHGLNIGFIQRMQTGMPWVRVKIAATLDGNIAAADGSSQWITAQPARDDGHHWRGRAQAILTTATTVIVDKARLNARLDVVVTQPDVYVLDTNFSLPPTAAIYRCTSPRQVIRIGSNPAKAEADDWLLAGDIELAAIIRMIGATGVNELHVEAGGTLVGALQEQGLIDEIILYQAAAIVGGQGRRAIANQRGLTLAELQHWQSIDTRWFGSDLRRVLRPAAK